MVVCGKVVVSNSVVVGGSVSVVVVVSSTGRVVSSTVVVSKVVVVLVVEVEVVVVFFLFLGISLEILIILEFGSVDVTIGADVEFAVPLLDGGTSSVLVAILFFLAFGLHFLCLGFLLTLGG